MSFANDIVIYKIFPNESRQSKSYIHPQNGYSQFSICGLGMDRQEYILSVRRLCTIRFHRYSHIHPCCLLHREKETHAT
jgi:hypothetical protein